MGILDDILGTEKKTSYRERAPEQQAAGQPKVEVKVPASLSVRFLPVRLAARKDNRIDMIVKISNDSGEKQLLSFEAFLPPKEMIGFDATVVSKHHEKRLGNIEPGASKEFSVPIHGTTQTKAGNYPIGVVVNVHYIDYNKVMPTGIKRKIFLRVI